MYLISLQLTLVDGKYITFKEWIALEKPPLPEPPEDATLPENEELIDDLSSLFSED